MAFKSPEAAIRNVLVTNTAVSTLIGSRVYPVLAPDPQTAPLPFITWRRIAVQRSQTLAGPSGTPMVMLSLDIYAATYEAARGLADKCRVALDGWGGVFENTEVANVTLENESDGFAQLQGGDVPPAFTVQQTYGILWQES